MTHFNFVISQNAKWGHDVVSKLTTDVVTYCTEASNQKSKYAYRKKLFYKKSTG